MEKANDVPLEELLGGCATHAEAVNLGKMIPYIKPLRSKHESGFRHIEVGYCELNGPKQAVLRRGSDHIWWNEPLMQSCYGKSMPVSMNMDVDDWGRTRFYRGFVWDGPVLSTAMLKYAGNGKDQ